MLTEDLRQTIERQGWRHISVSTYNGLRHAQGVYDGFLSGIRDRFEQRVKSVDMQLRKELNVFLARTRHDSAGRECQSEVAASRLSHSTGTRQTKRSPVGQLLELKGI